MQTTSQALTSQRSRRKARHSRQISVRLRPETDQWLEKRAGGTRKKAEFVRQLIEQAHAQDEEQWLLAMFDAAAEDLDSEEREDREFLLTAFATDE